ncbi:MAG: hypothetical protein MJZ58_01270 [Paludibacteraceae bacterium]|nr:hypothetical protein [Paludibacteraceae bacterium]
MAQLTINQCQNCGKILAPGVTECGKCHTKHAIQPTVVNPLRFTAAQAADYRAQFQEQVAACPKDSNAQFAMGLTFLGLKNYELADEYLVKAVRLTPSNPDVYYYTALSLFHHRSVMNLSKAEMDRIEEWLNTAVQMQPKRKYLILQMILRQGMSSMGINVDTDKLSPAELMEQARITVQEEDEMVEIEQHVLITDEKTQILLDKLNEQQSTEDLTTSPTIEEALNAYNDFCILPKDIDNQYKRLEDLQDETIRQNFFDHLYLPHKQPDLSKPSYLRPLWRSTWKAIIVFVLWAILASIVVDCDWIGAFDTHIETISERMAELKTSKMTKKEIAEARKRATNAFEKDTTLDAQMFRLLYYYQDENEREHLTPSFVLIEEQVNALPKEAKYIGMQKTWKGWLGLIFFVLPILIWIIATISRFSTCAKERKAIQDENDAREADYQWHLKQFFNRPSIADYKLFCSLFAGPNDVSCIQKGDFVQEALRQAHISEKDVQNGNGKIFFSCYLTDTDDEGNDTKDPAVTLRDMLVRVCVAMRDSIVYIHGVWDTTSNTFPIFDQERLLYSQIANFRNVASYCTLEVISHSNNVLSEIIYAYGNYPSIFQYQGIEFKDTITYSNTRTSDFNEFYNSLIKMHTAYCKS